MFARPRADAVLARPSAVALAVALLAFTAVSCSSASVDDPEGGAVLGDWEPVLTAPNTEFYDLARVGTERVWVTGRTRCGAGDVCAGWQIVVYTSEDGGDTWQRSVLGLVSERNANAVYPLDGAAGMLAGGATYATTDGGRTWTETQDLGAVVVHDLITSAPGAPWAAGSEPGEDGQRVGVILQGAPDGRGWGVLTRTRTPATSAFNSLSAPTPDAIFAVGTRAAATGGFLLRSLNGGAGWQRLDLPYAYPENRAVNYYSVAFATPSVGWVAGDLKTLFKTTDGGETWTQQRVQGIEVGASPVLHVSARSEREALLGFGTGSTFMTTDGGERWQQVGFAFPGTRAVRAEFGPSGPALAITRDGQVLRTAAAR